MGRAEKLAVPRRWRVSQLSAGFSLVELMVAVAIIGILAQLAVPSAQRMLGHARRSEAKVNVQHIVTLQEAYLADEDAYWDGYNVWSQTNGDALPAIGFVAEGRARYGYSTCSLPSCGCAGAGCTPLTVGALAKSTNAIVPGCQKTDNLWWVDGELQILVYSDSGGPKGDCLKD